MQAALPEHDLTITATNPLGGAWFGYSMDMGKVGPIGDVNDDLVSCAIRESYSGLTYVGAAYVYVDDQLLPDASFPRLVPSTPLNNFMGFGAIDVVIGNVRGPTFNNLVMVPASARDGIAACVAPDVTVQVPQQGSVEIYDLQVSGVPTSLRPPCYGSAGNSDVVLFGRSVAVGDVTGDAIGDLVVGAPTSAQGAGRLYVFRGHSNFLFNPAQTWIALNAPRDGQGVSFAHSVDCEDVDSDGLDDIVVGRPNRSAGPGAAYVFRGAWIKSLFDNPLTVNTIVAPPHPTTSLHEYQTLPNPVPPVGGDPESNVDAFGWIVYGIGDMTMDGINDIAVHSEAADFFGSAGCPTPVPNAGALFVYPGRGDPAGDLVDAANAIELQTPCNPGPETDARFGRSAAAISWNDCTLGPSAGVLVGEPDATVSGSGHAGRVFLYRAPLTAASLPAWPAPLLEQPPADSNLFGSWIVAGDYLHMPGFPGQQFVVSARQGRASGAPVGSGIAYSYKPQNCSP
jgi:hypothetical protein